MATPKDRVYRLARAMTGEEIRENLHKHMLHSWYQEREMRIQIGGAAVVAYFPDSIEGLELYSPTADWTQVIVGSESYTALRFPGDFVQLFARTPDQW